MPPLADRRRAALVGAGIVAVILVGIGLALLNAPTAAVAAVRETGPADRHAAAEVCAADATLRWGFKESFRAYIDGSIANGDWVASDGAAYVIPEFIWAGGRGSYDGAAPSAELDFSGSVEFTGHGGVLDTTISAPSISFDGSAGTLTLDVAGTTQEGVEVAAAAVPFADLDLGPATVAIVDGVLVVEGITATLTEEGAAAFGTYPPGEPLDPMTLELAGCDPVVAPDFGPRFPVLAVLIGVAVVLLGAAIALAAVAARRRRRPGPHA